MALCTHCGEQVKFAAKVLEGIPAKDLKPLAYSGIKTPASLGDVPLVVAITGARKYTGLSASAGMMSSLNASFRPSAAPACGGGRDSMTSARAPGGSPARPGR